MNAVEMIGVHKIIKKHQVLKNINLKLEKGETYGFFGRNGSGKTMLFRAICGLIKPTSGQIKIFGKVLHQDISFPESLGIIIESPGFLPQYTGYYNLKILASIKDKISDKQIINSIARVGLNPDDSRSLKKYSLGMRQRLGIAQAIMERPDLIVLDEPTNGLDEEGVELVRDILKEEKERGATILIASHNKEDINILCAKKFKMNNGELMEFTE